MVLDAKQDGSVNSVVSSGTSALNKLKSDTKSATDAVANNYRDMARSIKTSMDSISSAAKAKSFNTGNAVERTSAGWIAGGSGMATNAFAPKTRSIASVAPPGLLAAQAEAAAVRASRAEDLAIRSIMTGIHGRASQALPSVSAAQSARRGASSARSAVGDRGVSLALPDNSKFSQALSGFASLGGAAGNAAKQVQGVVKHVDDVGKSAGALGKLAPFAALAGGAMAAYGAFRLVQESIGFVVSSAQTAITKGSELFDQMARTGSGGENLLVLGQAFENAGMKSGDVTLALARMGKALTGVNEEGEPTNKAIKRLGLNIAELKAMDPADAFRKVAETISRLPSAADRTTAAMELLGRGGYRALAMINDPNAFSLATTQIGAMGAMMEDNAQSMDAIADSAAQVHTKIVQFGTGIVVSLLPALEEMADKFNAMDFTSMGQGLGDLAESFLGGFDLSRGLDDTSTWGRFRNGLGRRVLETGVADTVNDGVLAGLKRNIGKVYSQQGVGGEDALAKSVTSSSSLEAVIEEKRKAIATIERMAEQAVDTAVGEGAKSMAENAGVRAVAQIEAQIVALRQIGQAQMFQNNIDNQASAAEKAKANAIREATKDTDKFTEALEKQGAVVANKDVSLKPLQEQAAAYSKIVEELRAKLVAPMGFTFAGMDATAIGALLERAPVDQNTAANRDIQQQMFKEEQNVLKARIAAAKELASEQKKADKEAETEAKKRAETLKDQARVMTEIAAIEAEASGDTAQAKALREQADLLRDQESIRRSLVLTQQEQASLTGTEAEKEAQENAILEARAAGLARRKQDAQKAIDERKKELSTRGMVADSLASVGGGGRVYAGGWNSANAMANAAKNTESNTRRTADAVVALNNKTKANGTTGSDGQSIGKLTELVSASLDVLRQIATHTQRITANGIIAVTSGY